GQVGTPVVRVVEHHHGLPPGRLARDLDSVLHRLGAGVEQRRALLEVTRREGVELLAYLYVGLVRCDHEAGVREALDLAAYRLDDARRGVAHGGHRDAGGEVDPLAALNVGQRAAAGVVDVGRDGGGDAPGHRRGPTLVQVL